MTVFSSSTCRALASIVVAGRLVATCRSRSCTFCLNSDKSCRSMGSNNETIEFSRAAVMGSKNESIPVSPSVASKLTGGRVGLGAAVRAGAAGDVALSGLLLLRIPGDWARVSWFDSCVTEVPRFALP